MAEGGEEIDLAADLLSWPFSRGTFQEKLDIVKKGQKTLMLASLSTQLSALASMATEKDFLMELQCTNNLYD